MAIAVHIPYDEGFVGEVARPDHGAWIHGPEAPFELGGIVDGVRHQPLHLTDEREIVGRIQKKRRPISTRLQAIHPTEHEVRHARAACDRSGSGLASACQSVAES